MKRVLVYIVLTIMLLSIGLPVYAQSAVDEVPENITKFATEDGLKFFKDMVASDLQGYGYNSLIQLNAVQLGQGFQVYYIDENKLKAANENSNIKSIAKLSREWEFFIEFEGEPKSFLTVSEENNQLHIVAAGGNAKETATAYETMSNQEKEFILLKDKNLRYFVTKNNKSESVVPGMPIEFAPSLDGMNSSNLSDSKKLVKILKYIQNDPTLQDKDSGIFSPTSVEQKSIAPQILIASAISLIIALLAAFATQKWMQKKSYSK